MRKKLSTKIQYDGANMEQLDQKITTSSSKNYIELLTKLPEKYRQIQMRQKWKALQQKGNRVSLTQVTGLENGILEAT